MTLPAAYFDGDGDSNRLDQPSDHHDKHASWQTDASGNVVGLVGPDGIIIHTLPVRADPVKIAVFGDSLANFGTPVSPDNMDCTALTAPFPGSGTTSLSYAAIDKLAVNYMYPSAAIIGHFGVSGETQVQMLARDQAAAGITRRAIADLINLAPDVAIVRASINDVIALTAASTQADIDAIYSNHCLILDRITSGVARVIDEGLFAYSPSSGTMADIVFRRAALVALNSRYKAYAAASDGRITFIDTNGILSNSDGTAITARIASDGYHLNQLGSWLLGVEEAAVLLRIFGPSARVRFPGTNVFTNPMFANTSAPGYGTAATGITYGASSSTRQNAKIETIDGIRFATVEHVMTGADPYGTLYVAFDPTAMSISANDVYGFECDFLVATLDGSPLPAASSRLTAVVKLAKTAAGSIQISLLGSGVTRPSMEEDVMVWHVSVPIKIQEASAALAASGSEFYVGFGTAVNGTYKIGIGNPRIVKLGVARATM